ncbi:hypothetical protein GPALN_014876 [Globodera pallida]|nr:hypothetical protein GPALN_014876 [Globodera pallida]
MLLIAILLSSFWISLHGKLLKMRILTYKSYFHPKNGYQNDVLTEQFDLKISYEYKMIDVPDNHFMDMRQTISIPTISNAPIDRVFQVELGPEAKLAQMLTVKIEWTSRGGISKTSANATFSRMINLDIYVPNFDKIYELNLGQTGHSTVLFSGKFNLDENIKEDEAVVMFVDVPLNHNENTNQFLSNINLMLPSYPLGCDVISRAQAKMGTRVCRRPNYTQPISVELNQFYGHEILGLTVNLFRLKTYAINGKEKRELGNCPICFNSFIEKQKISIFYEKHSIHSSCIENWILSHGKFCPKCVVEVFAKKVIKLEPCFTEVNLTLNAFSRIDQIANSKNHHYTNFDKRQAEFTMQKINKTQQILFKEIKPLAYELKLNKEIFTKFSTKNIENAKQDVNQILVDPLNDLLRLDKAKKLMALLVEVTETPELLAQKTLEELRIVREKSESKKNY